MTNRSMSATGSPWRHWPSHFPHMLQYAGRMISLVTASSFWSYGPNGCDMALMFSSNWSISVMLGTVVWTLGLRVTHLMAANCAPLGLGVAAAPPSAHAAAAGDLHCHDALARLRRLLDSGGDGRLHGEVVGRQDHVDVGVLRGERYHVQMAAVGADAGEADLAGFLGGLLRVDQVVVDRRNVGLAVQIPDIHEIRSEFLQAVIELRHGARLVVPFRLRGEHHVLALSLQRGSDHAFVVAVRVVGGRIEVGDSQIGAAFDDAAIGRDHAAEADGGDL